MKVQLIFENWSDVPPDNDILTRDDLEGEELAIYDLILPKLVDPGPEQLRMLACYSYASSEFRKAVGNKKLQAWLQHCMIYARNGLGGWKPKAIDFMELLLDDERDYPPMFYFLDRAWEIQS